MYKHAFEKETFFVVLQPAIDHEDESPFLSVVQYSVVIYALHLSHIA